MGKHETISNDQSTDSHIDSVVKDSLETLHCIHHHNKPLKHHVHVCVVCNYMIIGAKVVHQMNKKQLDVYKHHLGVESHKEFYGQTSLRQELKKLLSGQTC